MRNTYMMTACALALATAFASDASAAMETPYGDFSLTIGGVSQYRFRGIAQSDEHPTVQGSVDWTQKKDGGFYAGVWGSGVDFTDANVEVDIYGGYKFAVNGLNFDFGLVDYWYPGSRGNLDYDFIEAKGGVGYDFKVVNLTGTMYYSPDFFAGSNSALYVVTNASVPVSDTGVFVTGSWGRQWIDDNAAFGLPNYADWSLGLAYRWYGIDFTAKYVDTSLSKGACPDGCDAAGVFAISKTL